MRSKSCFLVVLLLTVLPCFAVEPNRFACADILLSADVPIHQIQVTLTGDDVKVLRIVDTFGGKERLVTKMLFRMHKHGPKMISVKAGFVFKRIPNESVPESEQVTLDATIDLLHRLNDMDWMQESFGRANGGSVTNGHLSHLLFATSDGGFHRERASYRILLIDKNDLRIKLVLEVTSSDDLLKSAAKYVDYGRAIEYYASSLEFPPPTETELREYNEALARELQSQ